MNSTCAAQVVPVALKAILRIACKLQAVIHAIVVSLLLNCAHQLEGVRIISLNFESPLSRVHAAALDFGALNWTNAIQLEVT